MGKIKQWFKEHFIIGEACFSGIYLMDCGENDPYRRLIFSLSGIDVDWSLTIKLSSKSKLFPYGSWEGSLWGISIDDSVITIWKGYTKDKSYNDFIDIDIPFIKKYLSEKSIYIGSKLLSPIHWNDSDFVVVNNDVFTKTHPLTEKWNFNYVDHFNNDNIVPTEVHVIQLKYTRKWLSWCSTFTKTERIMYVNFSTPVGKKNMYQLWFTFKKNEPVERAFIRMQKIYNNQENE
jgi:hypothetical protein